MSHSSGQVRFNDGTILHYKYNGTSDMCCTRLYNTFEEMNTNWRKDNNKDCICDNSEEVEIASTSSDGFFWSGKACRKCMAITDGADYIEVRDETEGLPDWYLI